jgi:hypothetical protein
MTFPETDEVHAAEYVAPDGTLFAWDRKSRGTDAPASRRVQQSFKDKPFGWGFGHGPPPGTGGPCRFLNTTRFQNRWSPGSATPNIDLITLA